jgi:hypothetical protein
MKNNGLGGDDGLSDVGHVDMWGLDEYGMPVEGGLSDKWGVVIGGGVSTAAAITTRALWKSANGFKYAEGVGLLAGLVAGGALYAGKKTRAAGITAMITAGVTSGLRQIETFFMMKNLQAALQPAAAAPVKGWGMTTIEPTPHVYGLGVPTIEQLPGVVGAQMSGPMPTLVGAGMGAPKLPTLVGANLASHYGATIVGVGG